LPERVNTVWQRDAGIQNGGLAYLYLHTTLRAAEFKNIFFHCLYYYSTLGLLLFFKVFPSNVRKVERFHVLLNLTVFKYLYLLVKCKNLQIISLHQFGLAIQFIETTPQLLKACVNLLLSVASLISCFVNVFSFFFNTDIFDLFMFSHNTSLLKMKYLKAAEPTNYIICFTSKGFINYSISREAQSCFLNEVEI